MFFTRGSTGADFYSVDVDTGETGFITGGLGINAEFALSPDSETLIWAGSCDAPAICVKGWDLARDRRVNFDPITSLDHPSFFPDGRRLVMATRRNVGEPS